MNRQKFLTLNIVIFLICGVFFTQHSAFPVSVQGNPDSPDYASWFVDTLGTVSSFSDAGSLDPELAVDTQGNVHVVWEDYADYGGAGTDQDIWYRKFLISTETWQDPVLISDISSSSTKDPAIVIDSLNNIHILWIDYDSLPGDTDTYFDLYHRMWNITDSWSDIILVSTESTDNGEAVDAVIDSQNVLHVVWQDYTNNWLSSGADSDIFYTKYDPDLGWDASFELISDGSTSTSQTAEITADPDGNLHVTWADDTDDYVGSSGSDLDVVYRKWDSDSETWQAVDIISSISSGSSYLPEISSDSEGNIFIGWYDETDHAGAGTDWDVFLRYWDNTIEDWSGTLVVSEASISQNSFDVDIAIDSYDIVHFCWRDYENVFDSDNQYDVWYKSFNLQTSEWSQMRYISEESISNVDDPRLVVGGDGFVYFVWEDTTNYPDSGVDTDIKYRRLVGPPEAPELATIVPNPSTTGNISLSWEASFGAKTYKVYRESSYIFSTGGLTPITTTASTSYEDLLLPDGTYYYAVIADNNVTISELSNVEYVEVEIPPDIPDVPAAPQLAPFAHEVDTDGEIALDWNDVSSATKYYIYRETSYFWDTTGLTAIANTTSSNHTDTVTVDGTYYYAVTAENAEGDSPLSNIESIEVLILDDNGTVSGDWNFNKELLIVGGVLLGIQVILAVITLVSRKKK